MFEILQAILQQLIINGHLDGHQRLMVAILKIFCQLKVGTEVPTNIAAWGARYFSSFPAKAQPLLFGALRLDTLLNTKENILDAKTTLSELKGIFDLGVIQDTINRMVKAMEIKDAAFMLKHVARWCAPDFVMKTALEICCLAIAKKNHQASDDLVSCH